MPSLFRTKRPAVASKQSSSSKSKTKTETVEAAAITIRPVEPSDLDALYAVAKGNKVMPMTGALPSLSRAAYAERVATRNENHHVLGAIVDNKVVGMGGLMVMPKVRMRHVATLFIEIHDDYQGRGIGKALMTAIIDLADQWIGLIRVELYVNADHHRAIALYKQFGFEEEGRLRMSFFRNGEYIDSLVMGRIRPPPLFEASRHTSRRGSSA